MQVRHSLSDNLGRQIPLYRIAGNIDVEPNLMF